ncbi:MAG: metal ABC transporter permease [Spirulina sp. SIO3F2]|nr:metal ABC transporter permease [Spirulina sp. SIO3F2]
MTFDAELTRVIELFQFPFMQRALLGGLLIGLMGGLLGSLTVLRQLAFFSNALGHSALLGLSLGILLGINPSWTLLPFAVLFALAVIYLFEHTKLWTDALLNMMHSSFLAIAIILLTQVEDYKGGINNLLFGDILAIQPSDLILSGVLLVIATVFITLTLRTQMLVTLNESMAIARGVDVAAQRHAFIILLALVVGVAIKAIGVMLVSAFIVIPACAARLLSGNFTLHILYSTGLGALSAVLGIVLSAFFDLPSGPTIVVTQLAIFLGAVGVSKLAANVA